jgi:thermitase
VPSLTRRGILLPLTFVAVTGGGVLSPAARAQSVPDAVPGEVLVGLRAPAAVRSGAPRPTASARLAVARSVETAVPGAAVVGEDPALGALRVRVAGSTRASLPATLARLRGLSGVAYAEPNYYLRAYATPNDSYYTYQWAPQKIQADLAWEKFSPKAQTVVAVVDTGVESSHPDLVGKVLRDASGAVVGYDFVSNDADPTDDNGHGTHCAGVIAAQTDNGTGIAGLAGWNGVASATDGDSAKVMPVKVLAGDGSGSTSAVAQGIVWAADHGAKVVSLSLGGPGTTTLQNAVDYAWGKGVVIVAAAGNDGVSTQSYPAAYANVLSVAATDRSDTLASFSNYGSWVSVAAPGVDIASTVTGAGYAYMSGTSMATPHVAGEAALLLSQNPQLTGAQVRSLIVGNTDPVTPYAGRTIAGGRINVLRALNAAAGTTTTTPPPAPAPLAAPTSLVASSGYSRSVPLRWADNAADETGYAVEISQDGGRTFRQLGTQSANATSCTVNGLSRYTSYAFRVRAYRTGTSSTDYSAYSNVASARTSYY